MKEATGGALLLGLVAVILMIFIVFACFFISYGRTFKKKNEIINYIEQNEGAKESQIRNRLRQIKYNENAAKAKLSCQLIGKGTTFKGFVIKVTLYMKFDASLEGSVFNWAIPVSGETVTISSGQIYDQIKASPNKVGTANSIFQFGNDEFSTPCQSWQ